MSRRLRLVARATAAEGAAGAIDLSEEHHDVALNLPIRRQLLETFHWALRIGGSRKQSEKQHGGPREIALSPFGVPA